MKWFNHRCITTSLAAIGCLAIHQTLYIPDVFFAYAAYTGSVLPDRQEKISGKLSFKNHRQSTHYALPHLLVFVTVGIALTQLNIENLAARFAIITVLSSILGLTFGVLLHIVEDALTGTVPHPFLFKSKKRVGKALISEPYEYLLSAICITIAGMSFMYVTVKTFIER